MEKRITLSRTDKYLLLDVLEYILNNDDKEKNDFIENVKGENMFNEHDVLIFDNVPAYGKSHIYYKASVLFNELMDSDNE